MSDHGHPVDAAGNITMLKTDLSNNVLKERRKIWLQLDELVAVLKTLSAPAVLASTCEDAWECASLSITQVAVNEHNEGNNTQSPMASDTQITDSDKNLICTLNCLVQKLLSVQPLSRLEFDYVERVTAHDPAASVDLDACKELEGHSVFLNMFLDKGVKRLIAEQSLLKNKYSDITTLAIFFSSISATALQYMDAHNNKITSSAVNTLWIASLVSSIAAAGNGLLAMSWHTSFSLAARSENARRIGRRLNALGRNGKSRRRNGDRHDAPGHNNNVCRRNSHRPGTHDFDDKAHRRNGHHLDDDVRDDIDSDVLDRWLENCPMAFLVLSGILFIIGLVFYLYVIQQHLIVKIISIALIGGHTMCLARLVTKFMLDTTFNNHAGSLRSFLRAVEIFFMLLSLPLFIIFDILSLTGWRFVDQFEASYESIRAFIAYLS